MEFDKLPDCVGHLVINCSEEADGAILSSGGDLQNDESTAKCILSLVQAGSLINVNPECREELKRLSVVFPDCCYVVTVAKKKIYVAKRTKDSN